MAHAISREMGVLRFRAAEDIAADGGHRRLLRRKPEGIGHLPYAGGTAERAVVAFPLACDQEEVAGGVKKGGFGGEVIAAQLLAIREIGRDCASAAASDLSK